MSHSMFFIVLHYNISEHLQHWFQADEVFSTRAIPYLSADWIGAQALSLEPFKEWRKFSKIIDEEDGGVGGEMLCLLLLSHLLSKVPKEWAGSNGRDQSSLGSMGGLPSPWIAESGFRSGLVQGEGRDSWLDICRHPSTWGLNMLSSYHLWSDHIPQQVFIISSVSGLVLVLRIPIWKPSLCHERPHNLASESNKETNHSILCMP